jgi:hypothetical protein
LTGSHRSIVSAALEAEEHRANRKARFNDLNEMIALYQGLGIS